MFTLEKDGILRCNGEPAIPPLHTKTEIAWHIRELRRLFGSDFTPPASLTGDGIVTTSLGPHYAVMAEILRRMIRDVDATIPLQIWHDGHVLGREEEREKGGKGGGGADSYTTYIDIRQLPPRTFQFAGFSWKSFAVLNSGFRRALFLDCDAYPVAPVRPLFDLLSPHLPCSPAPFLHCSPSPHPLPAWVLWSGAGNRIQSYFAEWTGVTKPAIPPDTQGGQWLVDLGRAWKEVSIMAWIDAHGDYFYQHNLWHDEASSRMVLSELETPYMRMHADYTRVMTCYDHEGRPAIVHRIWSKLWPDCVPKWDHSLPKEKRVIELFRELAGAGYRTAMLAPCRHNHASRSPARRAAAIRARIKIPNPKHEIRNKFKMPMKK